MAIPSFVSNGFTNLGFSGPPSFSEGDLGSPYQGGVSFDPYVGFKLSFGPNSPYADVEELFDEISGTPFNAGGARTYIRRFRVRVKKTAHATEATHETAIYAGPVAVCQCPGIPVPYAPYIPYRQEEWDLKALAIMIFAARENPGDHQSWIVTVTYSTEMPPGGPTYGLTKMPWHVAGNQSNPWELPVVKEYDSETYTEYPLHDLKGRPFLDAAGRPFNPTIPVLKGDRVLTLTRNERFYETRLVDYDFTYNKTKFLGRDVGYAFCMGSRGQQCWLGPTEFFRVTYKILLRRKKTSVDGTVSPAFNPQKALNAGMYQKATLFGIAVPSIVPIIRHGQQVSAPVLLDLDGKEQTTMRNVTDPTTGQVYNEPVPTYRYFDVLEEAELNDLLTTGG